MPPPDAAVSVSFKALDELQCEQNSISEIPRPDTSKDPVGFNLSRCSGVFAKLRRTVVTPLVGMRGFS